SILEGVFPFHSLQQREIRKHLARTQNHRRQRIVCDKHRQPGLSAQTLVEVREQRATTSQHHATIDDIGGKLRRSTLERYTHRIDNRPHRRIQRLSHFL